LHGIKTGRCGYNRFGPDFSYLQSIIIFADLPPSALLASKSQLASHSSALLEEVGKFYLEHLSIGAI
jgi:hypothetical protein